MCSCLPGPTVVPQAQAQELADIRCEQVANVDSHEIDSAMLLALARQQGAMFVRLIQVPGKV